MDRELKKMNVFTEHPFLDVTPTILTMFGFPIGADMDGNVLVNAFRGDK
jgi:hypothetical protein